MASGDVIGIINSDDVLARPDTLSRILETFERDHCDAVYSDLYVMDYETMQQPNRVFIAKRGRYKLGWYPPHSTLYVKRDSIGQVLSGLSMPVEQWTIVVYGVLLMLASFNFKGEKTNLGREKAVFFIAGFITVLLTMIIFFLSWTSNTRDLIEGIQGRYFIPILPLFYMCLNNPYIRIHRPAEKNIIVSAMLINISILHTVFFATI